MTLSGWLQLQKKRYIQNRNTWNIGVNFVHILKVAALIPNALLIRISILGGFTNQISLESVIDPLGILFSILRMFMIHALSSILTVDILSNVSLWMFDGPVLCLFVFFFK